MNKKQIKQIKKGNKEAFKTFYDAYIDKALRVAMGISKNKEIAKEAVQETFIRVYKGIDTFDASREFDPWFYRILTNECNRILKRESKVIQFQQPEQENMKAKEEEDYTDLNQAIESLGEMYRVPLILKYIKGFSEREIAETLELNQNTVKTRLFKAREMLKQKLILLEDGRNTNV